LHVTCGQKSQRGTQLRMWNDNVPYNFNLPYIIYLIISNLWNGALCDRLVSRMILTIGWYRMLIQSKKISSTSRVNLDLPGNSSKRR
jgi:hypothetical protein